MLGARCQGSPAAKAAGLVPAAHAPITPAAAARVATEATARQRRPSGLREGKEGLGVSSVGSSFRFIRTRRSPGISRIASRVPNRLLSQITHFQRAPAPTHPSPPAPNPPPCPNSSSTVTTAKSITYSRLPARPAVPARRSRLFLVKYLHLNQLLAKIAAPLACIAPARITLDGSIGIATGSRPLPSRRRFRYKFGGWSH